MRLILFFLSMIMAFNANAQTEKNQWKLKREFPIYNNAWWKLEFRDGIEDFKTVKLLDFKVTKDSSFIGAWTPAYTRNYFKNHELNDELVIEHFYSLNDTVYKNIYHVNSDSIWSDWLSRISNFSEFYLKENYQGKPILQGYLPSINSKTHAQKLDYFYAISADDSSMVAYRKTHSYIFSFDTLFEKFEKVQTKLHYELLAKMKELTEAKDIETKKMIYEMGKNTNCKELTYFINNITNNIENYMDTKEALVKCISISIKSNDVFSVMQQKLRQKQLYKTNDLQTIGWYKIPVSVFEDAQIRLFQKDDKYYAAIIYDFNMTILEVTKSEEPKSGLKFTPIVEDDIFNIRHLILLKKNKILSLEANGKSGSYDSFRPRYDEWYCDVFFGEPTIEMKKKYPWR